MITAICGQSDASTRASTTSARERGVGAVTNGAAHVECRISRVLTERAASRGSLGHLPQYACRVRRPRSANFLIRGCLARQGRATVSIDAQFNLKSNRDRACV
ncbi:hypothetical protein ACJJTC_010826 [Scirpophaga incertulas]